MRIIPPLATRPCRVTNQRAQVGLHRCLCLTCCVLCFVLVPISVCSFTRALESLDGLSLDGLTEEERTVARSVRKEQVRRTEGLAARADKIR